jgi:beta-lactamase class A
VTLATLDAIDREKARLDEELTIGPKDLTLFHQPLRAAVLEQGEVRAPIGHLIFSAITRSDNTANDRLLRRIGGPDHIRQMLQQKGLGGIRFGPGERLMQSEIAGIRWSPELSLGSNFDQARARLPMAARQAALSQYLADPVDGATPSGITQALSLLASEQLLSPAATRYAMDTLALTHSGPKRLKGGVPPDWKIYHKTGTGQVLGPLSTGYNDVGILEAPDGARYAVAVMIGETRSAIPDRMKMMQLVTAAVTHHHLRSTGGTIAVR